MPAAPREHNRCMHQPAETPSRSPELEPTVRTRLRRKAERGHYDWHTIAGTLDAGMIAHVGYTGPEGVVVLPMIYARIDDQLYLHGAAGNAMLRQLASGIDVCVTVTIVDGLVLSRSAFHHSMNYRSVAVFGRASVVDDPDEKSRALRALVDHNLDGRSDDCRGPSASELRTTRVVRLPISEASAKVRTGPPVEEPGDLELPFWGGVIPLTVTRAPAVADEYVPAGAAPPSYP
jgi:nitroimidazol reductase NimA-like FMN-containing flavoprotein (pyridoxamine 5'-phosphate oxidase superfamily)